MENKCSNVRREAFGKRLPYDKELAEIAGRAASHRFLINAASQNTYLYQVEFVQAFCEHHFQKPLSRLTVLDWGCGKGHATFMLQQRGASLTSCDYCLESGRDDDSAFGQQTPIISSRRIKVDRLEDAIKLPYGEGAFDAVLSFGVLEHVENDFASLLEIRRVLRPGGVLFCFNLPYFLSWGQRLARWRGDDYHQRLYDEQSVRHLLARAEYRLIDIWHRQLFPKNRVRYPFYRFFEALDQSLVCRTPLKYLATNIEFVATVG